MGVCFLITYFLSLVHHDGGTYLACCDDKPCSLKRNGGEKRKKNQPHEPLTRGWVAGEGAVGGKTVNVRSRKSHEMEAVDSVWGGVLRVCACKKRQREAGDRKLCYETKWRSN